MVLFVERRPIGAYAFDENSECIYYVLVRYEVYCFDFPGISEQRPKKKVIVIGCYSRFIIQESPFKFGNQPSECMNRLFIKKQFRIRRFPGATTDTSRKNGSEEIKRATAALAVREKAA